MRSIERFHWFRCHDGTSRLNNIGRQNVETTKKEKEKRREEKREERERREGRREKREKTFSISMLVCRSLSIHFSRLSLTYFDYLDSFLILILILRLFFVKMNSNSHRNYLSLNSCEIPYGIDQRYVISQTHPLQDSTSQSSNEFYSTSDQQRIPDSTFSSYSTSTKSDYSHPIYSDPHLYRYDNYFPSSTKFDKSFSFSFVFYFDCLISIEVQHRHQHRTNLHQHYSIIRLIRMFIQRIDRQQQHRLYRHQFHRHNVELLLLLLFLLHQLFRLFRLFHQFHHHQQHQYHLHHYQQLNILHR